MSEFTAATRNVINHVMGLYVERADTPVCPYRMNGQAGLSYSILASLRGEKTWYLLTREANAIALSPILFDLTSGGFHYRISNSLWIPATWHNHGRDTMHSTSTSVAA